MGCSRYALPSMCVSAVLLAGMLACQSASPQVQLGVTLRSPLTAQDITYGAVIATQDSYRTMTVLTPGATDLQLSLQLAAGQTTRLDVVLFNVTANAWLSYEASQIFVPGAGSSTIEMAPVQVASQQATITPAFDGQYGVSTQLPLDITDNQTGYVLPSGLFMTGQAFAYPPSRSITFSVHRADDGIDYSLDTAVSPPPTGVTHMPFGPSPVITITPQSLTYANNQSYTNSSSLTPSTSFAITCDGRAIGDANVLCAGIYDVECGLDADCQSAHPLTPCDQALSLDIEKTYDLCVRLAQAPDLQQTAPVVHDVTKPVVTMSVNPSVFDGLPGAAVLTISGNEPLLSTSGSLLLNTTCNGVVPSVLQQASSSQYTSNLDLSKWDMTDCNFEATGTDLAGNLFDAYTQIRGYATPTLEITNVQTFPAVPSPIASNILIAVDVINETTGSISDVTLDQSGLTISYFGTMYYSSMPYGGATTIPYLARGATGRIWVNVTVNQYYSGNLPPPETVYTMTLTVQGSASLGVVTGPPANIPIEMRVPRLHWAGPGPLVISARTGTTPYNQSFPTLPTLGGSNSLYQYTVADRRVAAMRPPINYGLPTLVGVNPGTTTITALDGDQNFRTTAAIGLEVDEPPYLLALKQSQVIRRRWQQDDSWPLAANIGQPQKLLWDSSRDHTIVIGSVGVEVFDADGVGTAAPALCGATKVIDGVLSGKRGAAGAPNLLLLVEKTAGTAEHCEVDLDTMVPVVLAQPLALSQCAEPTQLVTDPWSDVMIALSSGCVTRYHVPSTNVVVDVESPDSARLGAPTHAVYDPLGAYAVYVANSSPSDAVGVLVQGSPALMPKWPYGGNIGDSSYLQSRVNGATIDPLGGSVLLAVASQARAGNWVSRLVKYRDRLAQPGDKESFDVVRPLSGTDSSQSWTRVLVDTDDRLLFAAQNGAQPSLWTLNLDDSNMLASTLPVIWSDGEPVIDLAVAGPQPVTLQPLSAAPGQLVTISGSGFAGQGRDEVFVNGIAAEVVSSDIDRVMFRVPPSFAELLSFRSGVWVSVRSNGQISGPVLSADTADNTTTPGILALTIVPISPYHGFSGDAYAGTANTCPSGSCATAPTLLSAPSGILSVNATGGLAQLTGSFGGTSSALAEPAGPVLTPLGQRVVGVGYDAGGAHWIDTHMLSFINAPMTGSPVDQRIQTISSGTLTSPGPIAIDPAGRVLAVADGSTIYLYSATTLIPWVPALPNGPAVDGLTFLGDDSALLAVSAGGSVKAYDLTSGMTSLPVSGGTGQCGPGAFRVLAVSPVTASDPQALIFLYDRGKPGIALVTVTATTSGLSWQCLGSGNLGAPAVGATIASASGFITAIDTNGSAYIFSVGDFPAAQSILASQQPLQSAGSTVLISDESTVYTAVSTSTYSYATIAPVPPVGGIP